MRALRGGINPELAFGHANGKRHCCKRDFFAVDNCRSRPVEIFQIYAVGCIRGKAVAFFRQKDKACAIAPLPVARHCWRKLDACNRIAAPAKGCRAFFLPLTTIAGLALPLIGREFEK